VLLTLDFTVNKFHILFPPLGPEISKHIRGKIQSVLGGFWMSFRLKADWVD